jgi:hypothetical protein
MGAAEFSGYVRDSQLRSERVSLEGMSLQRVSLEGVPLQCVSLAERMSPAERMSAHVTFPS